MKKNRQYTKVRACVGAMLALAGGVSKAADETKAAAATQASSGGATSTTSTEAVGNVSIKVSATGRDGKPVTQSSAVTLSSDGTKQKVTVTTVGPDGKLHTVTNEGQEGKMPPIPLPFPDGRKMAMSLHPAPTRIEKVTYAGLVVEDVPEVLGKHLPIPKGMGLVVTEVLKDSPAEKAGIRKDDILLRFDDQLLATQDQLRKLTRSRKTGDQVRFGIVHEGRETSMEVTLAERDEDVSSPGHGPWLPFGWMKEGSGGLPNLREAAEKARLRAAEVAKSANEVRRRVGERLDKAGEAGPLQVPGIEAVERLERELRKLREEVERNRVTVPGHSAEGERPRVVPRDGERAPGGPRDGERAPGGPRDGERAPGGPRDGERAPGGPRDGERAPGGPRDGERAPGGPRDGERAPGGPRP